MQAQTLPSFDFEGLQLRVFGDAINPLFVAADVCKALGIQNVTQAVRALAPFERTTILIDLPNPKATANSNDPMLNIGSLKKEVNVVNESGLYTLILRSREAVKEGSAAYRFRVKVTSEILPAIRRTGCYEVPGEFIDTEDQYEVRKAVKARAKNCSVHYQTIYTALYDEFKIPTYKQLQRSQLKAALSFIENYEIKQQLPKPEIPEGAVVLEGNDIERIRNFVYYWRYLFRPQLETIHKFLQLVDSPMSGRFYEAVHSLNLALLETQLERQGYPVKEMRCYKYLMATEGVK